MKRKYTAGIRKDKLNENTQKIAIEGFERWFPFPLGLKMCSQC